jgi:hypothetical protein
LSARRAWRASAALALGALSSWGCSALIGADFDAHLMATGPDGTSSDSSVSDDGPSAPDGCNHALVPDKPTDGGGPGDIGFTVALASIDYGDDDTDAGPGHPKFVSIGYDLDRTCRGMGTPSCKLGPGVAPEGNDGRDNAGGALVYQLKNLTGGFTAGLGSAQDTRQIQRGAYTLLLRVSGYNGEADDGELTVEWYAAAPFAAGKDGGVDLKPRWNGEDDWPIRAGSAVDAGDGGITSTIVTTRAYVTNHVLVANIGEGRIVGGSVPFDLVELVVTANVAPTKTEAGASAWTLERGVVAGRWKTKDILAAIPLFRSSNAALLCPGPSGVIYDAIKGKVCAAADISSNIDLGASTPCNALSLGMLFESTPVRTPTTIVDFPPSEGGCPPSPQPDTCDTAAAPDAGKG